MLTATTIVLLVVWGMHEPQKPTPFAGDMGLRLLGSNAAASNFKPGTIPEKITAGFMQQRLDFTVQHYFVSPSKIPGAGLGVFAKHNLTAAGFLLMWVVGVRVREGSSWAPGPAVLAPAGIGTKWNIEDAEEGNTWRINKMQWEALSNIVTTLQNAGAKSHGLIQVATFITSYAYYCKEADLMIIALRPSIFTDYATEVTRKRNLKHILHDLSTPVANSGFAWSLGPKASAQQAARLGVTSPTLHERCTLSRSLRDIAAGEEIMEDYSTYSCPWAGCDGDVQLHVHTDSA
eukprot:gene25293-10947_t